MPLPRSSVSEDRRDKAKPEESAGDPLRWLARTQNVSGSWGRGATEVEMTAAALLAFARAGHTTRAGHYRRQIAKALKWLLAQKSAGFAAQARAAALAALGAGPVESETSRREAEPGRQALPATGPLTTLDQLRAAVLAGSVREVAPEVLQGPEAELAGAWVAALRAHA